jgi:hypothetical protein
MPTELDIATDTLVRAAAFPPDRVASLRASFDATGRAAISSGFHGPFDIDSLDGLPGTYLWPEDPLRIRTITFNLDPTPAGTQRQGRFVIHNGPLVDVEGDLFTFANGTDDGLSVILLQGNDGFQGIFIVTGVVSGPAGKISVLMLGDFNIAGALPNTRFVAVRLAG